MTDNAQTAIIRGLKAAIAAHNEHRVFNIGDGRQEAVALAHDDARLSVALNLWEGWSDSAAHNWLYYDGMKADDWPRLALLVIDAIANDRTIDDPKLNTFARSRTPSGLSRFLAWLRSMFGPMV
jgi:hypothetical protein